MGYEGQLTYTKISFGKVEQKSEGKIRNLRNENQCFPLASITLKL